MRVTRERIMECLDYNSETGVFTRKIRTSSQINIGDVAGFLSKGGYRQIKVNGKAYSASRMAFLITYGRWPKCEIDHINGNPDDNRITNLREVSRYENQRNLTIHRSGRLCGTYLHRDSRRKRPWESQMRVNGKHKFLGYFATEQEAHEAYLSACEKVGV